MTEDKLNREQIKLGLEDAKDKLEQLKNEAEDIYFKCKLDDADRDRKMAELATYRSCVNFVYDMINKHLPQ